MFLLEYMFLFHLIFECFLNTLLELILILILQSSRTFSFYYWKLELFVDLCALLGSSHEILRCVQVWSADTSVRVKTYLNYLHFWGPLCAVDMHWNCNQWTRLSIVQTSLFYAETLPEIREKKKKFVVVICMEPKLNKVDKKEQLWYKLGEVNWVNYLN